MPVTREIKTKNDDIVRLFYNGKSVEMSAKTLHEFASRIVELRKEQTKRKTEKEVKMRTDYWRRRRKTLAKEKEQDASNKRTI